DRRRTSGQRAPCSARRSRRRRVACLAWMGEGPRLRTRGGGPAHRRLNASGQSTQREELVLGLQLVFLQLRDLVLFVRGEVGTSTEVLEALVEVAMACLDDAQPVVVAAERNGLLHYAHLQPEGSGGLLDGAAAMGQWMDCNQTERRRAFFFTHRVCGDS